MTWDGTVPIHVGERCAYVEVPKAGCTSVKYALLLARGDTPPEVPDDVHRWLGYTHAAHYAEMVSWLAHRWRSWFRFTVVRDPIARFESFYYWRAWHERGAYGDINRYVMEEFVSDPWHRDIHVIPQTLLIGEDLSIFDYVGRTEDMADVERKLRENVSERCVVPHLNRSDRGSQRLTKEARARLRVLFARDFEVLGYD